MFFRVRHLQISLLVLVFVTGYLAFITADVVRGTFLDARFYSKALEENRIYDRVYSDLFADPGLADQADRLFGELQVDRSLVVSTLRLLLPPDTLQAGAERVIDETIAYLRGDTDKIEAGVDLTVALQNHRTAIEAYLHQKLTVIEPERVETRSQLVSAIGQLADSLAAGQIPESIPVGSITPGEAEKIAEVLLSPINREVSDALRDQIVAALTANDLRSAYALAAPALFDDRIAEALRTLQGSVQRDRDLNPFEVIAEAANRSTNRVLEELNRTRDTVNTFVPAWLPLASALVMGSSAGLIIFAFARGPRWQLRVGGLLFAGVGGAVLVVSWLFGSELQDAVLDRPFKAAITDPPEGWGLPSSLQNMIADIRDSLAADLSQTIRINGLLLLVPGLAGIGASFIHPRVFLRVPLRHVSWRVAITGVFVAVLGITLAVTIFPFGSVRAAPKPCNGHTALCDRPYDEVVYPATHNSMSTASERWLLPAHDVGIREQLDSGVRVLLIDTHYWEAAQNATEAMADRENLPQAMRTALEDLVVSRVLDQLETPPEGVFLCHATCWMGATRFSTALADVRKFLDENPRQVVTLFIEDKVSVSDTVAVFDETGLSKYAYAHPPGASWPTLGELVDMDKRLVVMAQRSGPPPDWFHRAWDLARDNPFTFMNPAEMSCDSNRGDPDNTLLLMNHWITKPSPDRVDAARINRFDFLLEKARECERIRGMKPNFIAVNFHTIGDLFEVVDELNGFPVDKASR